MIPDSNMGTDLEITEELEVSKTYKLSEGNIQGFADELAALKQAIYKELSTEMYEYPVYSFSYGIEIESLVGKDPIYVKIELKRRITECLLKDDRVISVDNFRCTVTGDELLCECDVNSIYGELSVSKGVSV